MLPSPHPSPPRGEGKGEGGYYVQEVNANGNQYVFWGDQPVKRVGK